MFCGVWWSISFLCWSKCLFSRNIHTLVFHFTSFIHVTLRTWWGEYQVFQKKRNLMGMKYNLLHHCFLFCLFFFFAIRASSGLYTLRAVQHRKTETSLSCKSGVGKKFLTALTILTSDSQNPLARCNFHSHGKMSPLPKNSP